MTFSNFWPFWHLMVAYSHWTRLYSTSTSIFCFYEARPCSCSTLPLLLLPPLPSLCLSPPLIPILVPTVKNDPPCRNLDPVRRFISTTNELFAYTRYPESADVTASANVFFMACPGR